MPRYHDYAMLTFAAATNSAGAQSSLKEALMWLFRAAALVGCLGCHPSLHGSSSATAAVGPAPVAAIRISMPVRETTVQHSHRCREHNCGVPHLSHDDLLMPRPDSAPLQFILLLMEIL